VRVHDGLPHALDGRLDSGFHVHAAHEAGETLTRSEGLECLPLAQRVLDRGVQGVKPYP
jgi:hypothetical protein